MDGGDVVTRENLSFVPQHLVCFDLLLTSHHVPSLQRPLYGRVPFTSQPPRLPLLFFSPRLDTQSSSHSGG